jgi:hypothetical protein
MLFVFCLDNKDQENELDAGLLTQWEGAINQTIAPEE